MIIKLNQLLLVLFFFIINLIANLLAQQYVYFFMVPLYSGILVHSIGISIFVIVLMCIETLIFKGTFWLALLYLIPITWSLLLVKNFVHINHKLVSLALLAICTLCHWILVAPGQKSLDFYTFLKICGMIMINNRVFDIFVEDR